MNIRSVQHIGELKLIRMDEFRDHRGMFSEWYSQKKFTDVLGDIEFVQDNFIDSLPMTLRGLHYQTPDAPMGKLVRVLQGEILDFAVCMWGDCKGAWHGIPMTPETGWLWVPPNYAHGFCTMDGAKVLYKATGGFHPEYAGGVRASSVPGIPLNQECWLMSDTDRYAPIYNLEGTP